MSRQRRLSSRCRQAGPKYIAGRVRPGCAPGRVSPHCPAIALRRQFQSVAESAHRPGRTAPPPDDSPPAGSEPSLRCFPVRVVGQRDQLYRPPPASSTTSNGPPEKGRRLTWRPEDPRRMICVEVGRGRAAGRVSHRRAMVRGQSAWQAATASCAGQCAGELAPRGVHPDALPHRASVGRVRVLAVEGGQAHGRCGSSTGSMNSLTPPTSAMPHAACANAIRPRVLPPPCDVSSQETAAASPPVPQVPANVGQEVRQPRVSHV